MGWTSHDQFIYDLTVLEQRLRQDFAKLTSPGHTAGGWHLLSANAGSPVAATFPGTDLLWQSCWETSGDGTNVIGQQHGGIPGGTKTKHAVTVAAQVVAAAGAPWVAKLVDLQGYYRLSGTNVTGTSSRTLINSNTFTASSSSGLLLTYTNDFNTLTKVQFTTTGTLPGGLSLGTDYYLVRVSATTARVATSLANAIAGTVISYTDAGTGTHTMTVFPRVAAGTQAFFVSVTAPTLGGPNLTASDYTNSAGTSGRSFQGSPTTGAAADAYATRVIHSGNAAGRYGPFLPRQAADAGVMRVNSFTLSGGTAYGGSGVLALCIAKPILDIPLPVTGAWVERDLMHQFPSLPKIEDGACLSWMLFGTGATTNASPFTGFLETAWGG